eukprot:TRINITY_DN73115_c0_g1_i1.p1 TRINITY_DN73115_c0_g1~~TRINITY_DN73115_c0_g1_i1.p1  ORF type:complete len:245 (-),score=24.82 TRINITY_DN73115_c0_g1_i1:3-737(-)
MGGSFSRSSSDDQLSITADESQQTDNIEVSERHPGSDMICAGLGPASVSPARPTGFGIHKNLGHNPGFVHQCLQRQCSSCCCRLQCFVILALLFFLLLSILVFGFVAPSYALLHDHLYSMWGFVLEQGHPYTAPVWMGEFGNSARGHYWNNLMHYLNNYDIDFAYWAINGLKWTTGHISITTGSWIAEKPHWSNETFGLLESDYWTVRAAWRLLDLQALMPSPAQWRPLVAACDRMVLGAACGD